MEKLYIALVDTPGIFANIIRHVIKISYCHVHCHLMQIFRKLTALEDVILQFPFLQASFGKIHQKYCGYFQMRGIVSVSFPAQRNRKNCCGKK